MAYPFHRKASQGQLGNAKQLIECNSFLPPLSLTGLHVSRPLDVDAEDAVVGLVVALRLEGRLADQELVAEHTQRPQVHLLVVGRALDHLRRQVVQRPAHRRPAMQSAKIYSYKLVLLNSPTIVLI